MTHSPAACGKLTRLKRKLNKSLNNIKPNTTSNIRQLMKRHSDLSIGNFLTKILRKINAIKKRLIPKVLPIYQI